MSNTTEKSWKNRLQEYCQRNKLGLPNYRIVQQNNIPKQMRFQVEVEVGEHRYVGEENCLTKKDAEQSAAEKACADLIEDGVEFDRRERSSTGSVLDDDDLPRHFPPEYARIEEFITTMITAFGGRIRKVRPLDRRGLIRVEITGNYRYCNNIQKHHKKNQVYFVVDPVKNIYYQRCYDPECEGFQSAKQPIYFNSSGKNQQEVHSTST